MADRVTVCPLGDLPPGAVRTFTHDDLDIGVFNCAGRLFAMEDRCSHDDGDLAEGLIDQEKCTVECPRHGSLFDLVSGRPTTLPAYEAVDVFDVAVEDGMVVVDVD